MPQTPTAIFDDKTPMPFGKYKGKAMVNVPAVYLLWLAKEGCTHEGVAKYIINNLDALNLEASKANQAR